MGRLRMRILRAVPERDQFMMSREGYPLRPSSTSPICASAQTGEESFFLSRAEHLRSMGEGDRTSRWRGQTSIHYRFISMTSNTDSCMG